MWTVVSSLRAGAAVWPPLSGGRGLGGRWERQTMPQAVNLAHCRAACESLSVSRLCLLRHFIGEGLALKEALGHP